MRRFYISWELLENILLILFVSCLCKHDVNLFFSLQAEEAEEDDEIERLFKGGKKKKKNDRPRADIGLIVEQFIAEFEVASEEDANLNRQHKPAINKLMKLPLLIEVLSK